MEKLSCFCILIKKNKTQENHKPSPANVHWKPQENLQIKSEEKGKPLEIAELKEPLGCEKVVMGQESHVGNELTEGAYEGEDEHEENASIKREFSDLDLQAHNESPKVQYSGDNGMNEKFMSRIEKVTDVLETGHVSDPGIRRAECWVTSPKLKRSCSNFETREVLHEIANHFPLSKSHSLENLQNLPERIRENSNFSVGSPASVMTHGSADRVMLKRHSSSQILPSRSRRLWWKLFLWSHRNLHKPRVSSKSQPVVSALNQQCGYSSDILEQHQATKLSKAGSPVSFTGDSLNTDTENCMCNSKKKFGASSGLWPHNQWVAFSAESSSFRRVDEWVKDLTIQNPVPLEEDVDNSERGDIVFPPSPEADRSPARHTTYTDGNISEAILHANSIIQSLNSSSTVAHVSNIGLKAIPSFSHFSCLRSINLSNNFIVRITPGSLPKGLHALNLSKNKISTIQGFKELTRLRVLDLSYNRISRIEQGLSNCALIKELYLAGNKISDVEGLHRLLKLTVLDLSFNKITTTKAIGQLVSNYNSLLALNLLGNPIQSNISDDQLRKAVCGLLPKLVYLNKQPIKPQRAREVLTDSVAKAALGNNTSLSSRRKVLKRGSSSGSASPGVHWVTVGTKQKGMSRSKNQNQHHIKKVSSSTQSALH